MDHFKGKQFHKDVTDVAIGYYLRHDLSLGPILKQQLDGIECVLEFKIEIDNKEQKRFCDINIP
jgi:transposase-like protein